jgi:ribosomal protein S18 acetylase RimI-like enzyme
LTLTPADVGRRVVVRHRLSEGGLTDILGELMAWTNGILTIRRKDGSVVDVRWDDLVAAKVVPPAPHRATSPRDLLAIIARSWGVAEEHWLGGWWLRAASGFTARANSVIPLDDPGVDLAEALDRVIDWYAQKNLPPRIQTVVGSPLDGELAARGWNAPEHGLTQAADLADARARLGNGPTADLRIGGAPTDAWIRRYRPDAPVEAARQVLSGGRDVAFATIGSEDNPLAVGRAAVEGEWIGIAALSVDHAHQRQGLGAAVMRSLLDFGAERGARRAYLQVNSDNEPALQMYAKLGFETHHLFHFLSPGTR